jgi:hypothetical protein
MTRFFVAALLVGGVSLVGVPRVGGGEKQADAEKELRPTPVSLQGRAAPDFVGGTWINTERPLGLPGLKGKLVLVQFTFIG